MQSRTPRSAALEESRSCRPCCSPSRAPPGVPRSGTRRFAGSSIHRRSGRLGLLGGTGEVASGVRFLGPIPSVSQGRGHFATSWSEIKKKKKKKKNTQQNQTITDKVRHAAKSPVSPPGSSSVPAPGPRTPAGRPGPVLTVGATPSRRPRCPRCSSPSAAPRPGLRAPSAREGRGDAKPFGGGGRGQRGSSRSGGEEPEAFPAAPARKQRLGPGGSEPAPRRHPRLPPAPETGRTEEVKNGSRGLFPKQ